jgi:hypothetical protein
VGADDLSLALAREAGASSPVQTSPMLACFSGD